METRSRSVSLKQDDLYARWWECEYEKSIVNADNDIATPLNSPEYPVQSDLSTEETYKTPRIAQECSRELFSETEELCNVTDTYPDMEPDAETIGATEH